MFSRFFAWVGSWFAPRLDGRPAFIPKRVVYRYWDGRKMVEADPIELHRRLTAVADELHANYVLYNSASKNSTKGHDAVIRLIRGIFDIKPLAEGGMTETDTLAIMDDFWLFVDDVKKNSTTEPPSAGTTSPLTPSSTEPASSASSDGPSPERKSSPSGSSETVSSTATRGPSTSVPESPSATSPPESSSSGPSPTESPKPE